MLTINKDADHPRGIWTDNKTFVPVLLTTIALVIWTLIVWLLI